MPTEQDDTPEVGYGKRFIFRTTGDITVTNWSTHNVPKWARIAHIFMMDSGGGAGGGFSAAAGTNRGGGGGGGAAGRSHYIVQTCFLPERLYLNVAPGGAGGGPAATGVGGQTSYICSEPFVTTDVVIIKSSQNPPGAGNPGGATGSAASGGTGTVLGAGGGCGQFLGVWQAYIGIAGGTGGTPGGPGTNVLAVQTGGNIGLVSSGGAGGGSVSNTDVGFAGGNVNGPGGTSKFTTITGGANTGKDGVGGWDYTCLPNSHSSAMFSAVGGSGGGGNPLGSGGNGGGGGIGQGGGGGGAGITGGRGGRGGDGLIVITYQ